MNDLSGRVGLWVVGGRHSKAAPASAVEGSPTAVEEARVAVAYELKGYAPSTGKDVATKEDCNRACFNRLVSDRD